MKTAVASTYGLAIWDRICGVVDAWIMERLFRHFQAQNDVEGAEAIFAYSRKTKASR